MRLCIAALIAFVPAIAHATDVPFVFMLTDKDPNSFQFLFGECQTDGGSAMTCNFIQESVNTPKTPAELAADVNKLFPEMKEVFAEGMNGEFCKQEAGEHKRQKLLTAMAAARTKAENQGKEAVLAQGEEIMRATWAACDDPSDANVLQ
jgi:hypothetical protein